MNVVALLDDRHATDANPTSRLYTGFVREHRCADPAALNAAWAAVEADQRADLADARPQPSGRRGSGSAGPPGAPP